MNKELNIKGLLIDIDGTLIRLNPDSIKGKQIMNDYGSFSLFAVLKHAGAELSGLSSSKTGKILKQVSKENKWWNWEDFIDALNLNAGEFWEYAFKFESEYIEVSGIDVLPVLNTLKENGVALFIATNNPMSGCRHKLRLAGLDPQLFQNCFSATDLKFMKWEPQFWQQVYKHADLPGTQLATLGDNLCDDYEVPFSTGIGHSFIINRYQDISERNSDSVTFVRNFEQVLNRIVHLQSGNT